MQIMDTRHALYLKNKVEICLLTVGKKQSEKQTLFSHCKHTLSELSSFLLQPDGRQDSGTVGYFEQ